MLKRASTLFATLTLFSISVAHAQQPDYSTECEMLLEHHPTHVKEALIAGEEVMDKPSAEWGFSDYKSVLEYAYFCDEKEEYRGQVHASMWEHELNTAYQVTEVLRQYEERAQRALDPLELEREPPRCRAMLKWEIDGNTLENTSAEIFGSDIFNMTFEHLQAVVDYAEYCARYLERQAPFVPGFTHYDSDKAADSLTNWAIDIARKKSVASKQGHLVAVSMTEIEGREVPFTMASSDIIEVLRDLRISLARGSLTSDDLIIYSQRADALPQDNATNRAFVESIREQLRAQVFNE